MENRVFAAMAEAGYGDITVAQARLLQRIGPDGTRLTVLAEAAQVTKQTAGFLVDQLERAGYVERVPDPADGRARLVRLTGRALEGIPVADREVAKVEQEWERHIGKRRMAQLRETLTMLREITDPYQ
ncbi:MarR family transcriptional regulator [Lentzea tibetensis]|uniref:MarR family transcriptional regulator n=2 Tax=Lentzea tibetensis TaxID=2591470 RepID=A0A563EK65_9PSEU|nr:MarR family transcriptional regulator [Lentzea tibetensis]